MAHGGQRGDSRVKIGIWNGDPSSTDTLQQALWTTYEKGDPEFSALLDRLGSVERGFARGERTTLLRRAGQHAPFTCLLRSLSAAQTHAGVCSVML
jgi:hypothetical protein